MNLAILFVRNVKSMWLLQLFAWLQSFSTEEQKEKKEHVRQSSIKRESFTSRNFPLAEDQQCQWLFQTTMRWRKILFAEKSWRLVQYRMAIRESNVLHLQRIIATRAQNHYPGTGFCWHVCFSVRASDMYRLD